MQVVHWVGVCDLSLNRPVTRLFLCIVYTVQGLTWPNIWGHMSKVYPFATVTKSHLWSSFPGLTLIWYIHPTFCYIPKITLFLDLNLVPLVVRSTVHPLSVRCSTLIELLGAVGACLTSVSMIGNIVSLTLNWRATVPRSCVLRAAPGVIP